MDKPFSQNEKQIRHTYMNISAIIFLRFGNNDWKLCEVIGYMKVLSIINMEAEQDFFRNEWEGKEGI